MKKMIRKLEEWKQDSGFVAWLERTAFPDVSPERIEDYYSGWLAAWEHVTITRAQMAALRLEGTRAKLTHDDIRTRIKMQAEDGTGRSWEMAVIEQLLEETRIAQAYAVKCARYCGDEHARLRKVINDMHAVLDQAPEERKGMSRFDPETEEWTYWDSYEEFYEDHPPNPRWPGGKDKS